MCRISTESEDKYMLTERFNSDWSVSSGNVDMIAETFGEEDIGKKIHLPHDAMILEERKENSKNGSQTGFYPGGIYHYKKRFDAPMEWQNKTVILEFEGSYMNTKVYINGDYAGGYPYGYTNFYVCLDHFLKYGEINEVKVIVNNSMELNTRWYSGSGLYRNVNLLTGSQIHIPAEGIRITTPEIEENTAVAVIETKIVNQEKKNRKICLFTEVRDQLGNIVVSDSRQVTMYGHTEAKVKQRMAITEPELWDCEHPNLYYCTVRILDGEECLDEVQEHFGVRRLSMDSQNGLRLNGKMIKLRGACIHHDNGVIGACTLERAEERRCGQLKAAGFNCIRSAHNPISKAMLNACDKLGMLVIDELSDVWTQHKNVNDYFLNFQDYWETDVERMVAKDFNHPSVIMYSMGNEIQEAGTAKGAEMNRCIAAKINQLDSTRYTTNALNGTLAAMDSLDTIIADAMSSKTEKFQVEAEEEHSEGGSDALNDLLGMLHGPLADAISTHPILSKKIDEFVDAIDVIGYNYLTGRHEVEHERYPNRVIYGAETFPADIVRLWDIVKRNNHVIGDMTWAGYDYLGEAGAGIFYYDGTKNFTPHWPDRAAYIGDIDIIGYRRPISYLREIVFGLRKEPYIAVERLNHYGEKSSKTPWMLKDNIASWTWNGFEGKPAKVDVYSNADEVELFLNGKSLGRKPAGEKAGYVVSYQLSYEAGELKALNYQNGVESTSHILRTASEEVQLYVNLDHDILKADGSDLSYITVSLKDKDGNQNLQEVRNVTVTVEGSGTLQGFGSAMPSGGGSYQDTNWNTYDGYVLAVVRAGRKAGEIKVTFEAEGCNPVTKIIKIKAED